MTTTHELVRLIQSERDVRIRRGRIARIAACARVCCHPTLADRVVRALGGNPATC
jgi:hypothetical protein